MKCKYCNAEIEQDAQFCPNCGKDLSKFMKCVKCSEILDDDTVFCPHCGTEQPHDEKEEATNSKKWIWGLAVVLLVGLIGGGYYFLNQTGSVSSNSAVAVDSDSIAVVDSEYDIHSVEGIKERLANIFSSAFGMSDKEAINNYFSQEYQQLYSRVNKIDNTLEGPGFWNGNIWDEGQDGNPNKADIISVNSSTDSKAYAEVKFIHSEGEYHSETLLSVDLLFENGTWYIDDVNGFKQRMKEYIKEGEGFSYEEKTNDGMYSMAGKVSKYAIHMTIEINGSDAKGYYYYDSQGSDNKVKLSGSLKENGELLLKKYSKDDKETGFFEGVFNGVAYSGKNRNYNRDEDLQFSVSVE